MQKMFKNSKFNVANIIACIIIIFMCLMSYGHCDQTATGNICSKIEIKYINCSPSNLCYSCYNQFFCEKCAPQAKCCPKYCKSCLNNTYCRICENGFQLIDLKVDQGQEPQKICMNNDPSIDINRDQINTHKCKQGYYLDQILQFCQRCLIPNCKTCLDDAMNCVLCKPGYYKSGDLCLPQKNNKVQPTPNPIQTQKNEDQEAMYILMLMVGMILGFFIACFAIKIFSFTKRNCGRFYNWCKNRYNQRKMKRQRQRLIDMQMNMGPNIDIPVVVSLSDEQKQFAFKAQMHQDRDYVEINDQIEIKNRRPPIITEARNHY